MKREAEFIQLALENDIVATVLQRMPQLGLPDWYLTAGGLFQTVWNVLEGYPPQRGILDYDVFYFAPDDLSWEAEDVVIGRAAELFGDIDARVEVRNEARVHLWYEEKFGRPCSPFTSSAHAIDSFASTTCSVGVRSSGAGEITVYAPYGLDDLFDFIIRPNTVLAPREVYDAKAARWQELWPRLQVLPWPA